MKRFTFWMSISLASATIIIACSGPDPQSGQVTPLTPTVDGAVPNASTPTATDVPIGAADNPDNPSEPTATTTAANPVTTPQPEGTTSPAGATDPSPTSPSPTVTNNATATPNQQATPTPSPTVTTGQQIDGVLPEHRVLSYYGHPSTGTMGILGEYSKEQLLQRLQEQAAAYEAADPDTPVKLAFELIATVAQPNPGGDGTYLLYTGDEWIGEYVEFAAANDMLVILDLQIGHSTIRDEIERISHWLTYPNVHVALDPEFSTAPSTPGEVIGSVNGNHVQIAVEIMSEIVQEQNLPAKMLIIHQFESKMIFNKSQIEPLPGVDVVLDVDGFGTPEAKIGDYNTFVRQQLIEYGGIKLFYKQDSPVMTPEQVVSLKPEPMLVVYQ